MDKAKLVEIYCVVDEFCKGADRYMAPKTLVEDGKRRRHRKLTIALLSDKLPLEFIYYFFSTSAVWVLVRAFRSLTQHHCVLATSSALINTVVSRAGHKLGNLRWAGFMGLSYIS